MKKNAIPVMLVIIFLVIVVTPISAYYSTITGELRNSKDNALWTNGASIEVFHCSTLTTIATGTAPAGTFSIDISSVSADTPLCVEVTFSAGANGTPGNAAKGPFVDRAANSGTLDSGVYFTGTGPTAVTLADFTPAPTTANLPMIAAAFIMLGSASYILLRRRTVQATVRAYQEK